MMNKDKVREAFGKAAQAGYRGHAKSDYMHEQYEMDHENPKPTNPYPPGHNSRRGANAGGAAPGVGGRTGRNGANS